MKAFKGCRRITVFTCWMSNELHQITENKIINDNFNPLWAKLQSNGPLYIKMVIGTLGVDGWAVTFGTVRRGLGGLRPHPVVPSSLYQM